MDSSEFFSGPEPAGLERDKDGYGRYLLDATGTGKQPFTRATTIAKMLDNTKGIENYNMRKAAKGVASSPALTARAAVTPLDDKTSWREILDQAAPLSGGDEKRDLGSAFHTFHEHVGSMTDEEYAAVPHELRVTYERYRAELERLGIEEVLTEVTVANTEIGVAGKLDAIFRLADGRLVIGDRKTGNVVKYPQAACVQLATYANADVMITWDGNGATIRHEMPEVDKTIALVVDITIGGENTAAVHVYELDIWSGWASALLSTKIRAWRNRRDLIQPYHPSVSPSDIKQSRVGEAAPWTPVRDAIPAGLRYTAPIGDQPIPRSVTDAYDGADHLPPNQAWFEQNAPGQSQPVEPADRLDANAHAGLSATAKAVLGTGPAIGTGDAIQPPHAGTHPAWSSKEQKVIALDSKGERVPDAPTPADAAGTQADSGAADVDALLAAFKTKAQLQAVLASVNPQANLARQRKNLAAEIVGHPTWPQRRAEFLPAAQPSVPNVGTVVSQTDVQGEDVVLSPVVSNAPGPVPPDPEPTIVITGPAQYPTVGGVSVELGQTNPFAPPPDPEPDPEPEPFQAAPALAEPIEDQLLRRIGETTSAADLAQVWEDARDAGIGWPARLHQAATVRQNQLTAAPAAQ